MTRSDMLSNVVHGPFFVLNIGGASRPVLIFSSAQPPNHVLIAAERDSAGKRPEPLGRLCLSAFLNTLVDLWFAPEGGWLYNGGSRF